MESQSRRSFLHTARNAAATVAIGTMGIVLVDPAIAMTAAPQSGHIDAIPATPRHPSAMGTFPATAALGVPVEPRPSSLRLEMGLTTRADWDRPGVKASADGGKSSTLNAIMATEGKGLATSKRRRQTTALVGTSKMRAGFQVPAEPRGHGGFGACKNLCIIEGATKEIGGARAKLVTTTAGIQKNAFCDILGTLNTMISPTPKTTALVIEKIKDATFRRARLSLLVRSSFAFDQQFP